MAQELEDLLIQVDSTLGDLGGIDSAISALTELRNFSEQAKDGAKSLEQMANAFKTMNNFNGGAKSIKKVKKDVGEMIKILNKLSKYTSDATHGISQLKVLGEALTSFAGVGDKLKGLDKAAEGINSLVDAMHKLSGISNDVNDTAKAMNNLGKSFFEKKSKNVNSEIKKWRDGFKQLSKQPKVEPRINTDGLEADEKKLESIADKVETTVGRLNKAPQSKGVKFKINDSNLNTKSLDKLTENITKLNEFRQAIESFDGIGQKLQGISDALGSIRGIIAILQELSEYTGMAGNSIAQFRALGEALQSFSDLGNKLEGLDKIEKGINKMIGVLRELSEYKGKATQSIEQFNKLGKALQEFSDLGTSLQGLDTVYKGISKMVEILNKLSTFSGDPKEGISQLKNLAKALHGFNGLDDNLASLNEIAVGLINLASATAKFAGAQKSDFDYLDHLKTKLTDFVDTMNGRKWAFVGQATQGIASLTNALKTVNEGDLNKLGTMSEKLAAFNNSELMQNAQQIANVFNGISDAFVNLNASSGTIGTTMDKLVGGFKSADESFYKVRESVQAIATDWESALVPLENSALFTTLERFKTLNDSYKFVGGLGQGLGALIQSLNDLNGKQLDTTAIDTLITKFDVLAKDTSMKTAIANFKEIGNIAQPIASLMNALKYSDLSSDNNVLSELGIQIAKFYEKLPDGFDKYSYVFYAIRDVINLAKESEGVTWSENNIIAKLGEAFSGFKNIMIGDISELARQLSDLMKVLVANGTENVNTQPISDIITALSGAEGIAAKVYNFTQAVASLQNLDKINTGKLALLSGVLERFFKTVADAPKGKIAPFKDVGYIANAISRLSNVDEGKMNKVAEALIKIMNALGAIQGSNNKINIYLDSTGVANFKKVVDHSNVAWDEFVEGLKTSLKDINMSQAFDLSGSLKDLRGQLRTAESMLRKSEREAARWRASIEKQLHVKGGFDNVKDTERFQRQVENFARAVTEGKQLRQVIENINHAMQNAPRFETSSEALQHVASLREEYERLRKVVDKYNGESEHDPTGHGFKLLKDRMADIEREMKEATRQMHGMKVDAEASAMAAKLFADDLERAEKASQEVRSNIGNGFEKFGSVLSGSGNGLINSIGKATSFFGKAISDGAFKLSEGALASLQNVSAVLGKLSFAIGAVGAVVSVVVAAFKTWWNLMNKVRESLVQFLQSLKEFAQQMLSKVVGAFNAVAGAVSKVASMVRSGAEIIVSALRKIGDIGHSIITVFGKIGNALTPAIKGFKAVLTAISPRIVKTLVSSNFNLSKIIKQSRILNSLVKTFTRYFSMMARMLMRKSITAFLNKIKQAFEDLAVFEKNSGDALLRFNTNVSMIFSALRRGANQWMAAFEPLINALTPTILNFLNNIQAMGENIAKFMAILTGQPYYIRAKQFYEDYGENVEETNKKVKNLTNSLDELNILNDQKDSNGINPEDMFEKVPVDGIFEFPDIQDILDKFKDWLKGIDWDKIKATIRDWIKRLFDIINQILRDKELWALLGETLGEMINVLFTALNEAFHDLDWKALGQAITEFLKNALETIDWDLIRDTVVTLAQGFANMLNEIFADKELWKDIGETIAHVINDVIVAYLDNFAWTFDFKNFADSLLLALKTALEGIDWEQILHMIEGWVNGIVDVFNTFAIDTQAWIDVGETIKNVINSIIHAFNLLAGMDFASAVANLKAAIKAMLDINWEEFNEAIKKWAQNLADIVNGLLADGEFLSTITTSLANFINGLIHGLDETLQLLRTYDIGKAIGDAIVNGLGNIDWDALFRLPADALNAFSNALRGLLDAIPEDFNLGTWITEHLEITLDSIDWDVIERNLESLRDQIANFIMGLLQNQSFWEKAGEFTGKVIKLGLDLVFEFFNINGQDLGDAISTYINNLIKNVNIGDYIVKTVDIALNLLLALDVTLTGIDWGEIGDQIAQGLVDAIDRLFNRRDLIRQTIEDAFSAISTLINRILTSMIANKSFFKIGQIIGEIGLGIIHGLEEFFNLNLDEILQAMKDFVNGLADFIYEHEDEIVNALNNIIDAIVEIIDTFFDEKSRLWKAILSVVERLNIGKIIGSIIRNLIIKLKGLFAKNSALWDALKSNLDDFAQEISEGIKAFAKMLWDKVKEKLGEWVKSLPKKMLATLLTGDPLASFKFDWMDFILKCLGLKNGLSLAGLFDGLKIKDEDKAKESLIDKIKGLFGGKGSKGDSGDKVKIPVEIEPEIEDGKKKLEDLVDGTQDVTLEFEDAKLGKIKTSLIDVKKIEAEKLNVDEIIAKTLTLKDIIGDKLKVKEIESENSTGGKKMDEFYGANDGGEGGVLGARRDAEFDKILARLLEITEKITAPLLEIAEKITAPLIEVSEKITVPLIEVAEKILTPLIEVTEKITVPLIEVSEKITTPLIEADVIDVTKILADLMDVSEINSELLTVTDIVADTLNVGTINGTLSGLGGGLGLFSEADIEKPTFEVGDRWSDISGIIESAEDFLEGFPDKVSTTLTDKLTDTKFTDINGTTWGVGSATNTLGGNDSNISSGTLTRKGASTTDVNLPEYAQYIKDYLMGIIGNENGVYGLMGNLYAESELRTNNLQNSANKNLGMTDEEYTDYINNGGKFADKNGYGLAQWTTSDRKNALLNTLGGRSIDDLDGQLEYLAYELQNNYSSLLKKLQNATSIHEASSAVLSDFEKPKNQSQNQDSLRWHYSEAISRNLDNSNGEIPKKDENGGIEGVDEFQVIEDEPTPTSDTPASGYFLNGLVLQTEYTMAEVYNTIDKWLGRIWRLLDSFEAPQLLEDLFEGGDLSFGGNAKVFKDILKQLKALNDKLDDTNEKLDDVIERLDAIIDAINNIDDGILGKISSIPVHVTLILTGVLEALKRIEDAIHELTGVAQKILAKLNEGIHTYNHYDYDYSHITDSIWKVTDALDRLSNILGTTGLFDKDIWGNNTKAIDQLTNTMRSFMDKMNGCCNCNCGNNGEVVNAINRLIDKVGKTGITGGIGTTGNVDNNTKAIDKLTNAIQNLGSKVLNVNCNCTCCCNCNGCGKDTPAVAGATRNPIGGSTGGGYNPISGSTGGGYNPSSGSTGGGYNPSSGSTGGGYNPSSGTTGGMTGGTNPIGGGKGGMSPIGRNTYPPTSPSSGSTGGGKGNVASGGRYIDWTNPDGTKAHLYTTIGGQRYVLSDDLPDYIKKLIMSGDYPIYDASGKNLDAIKRTKVLNFVRNRWGDKSNQQKDGGRTGFFYEVPKDNISEPIYAIIDGNRIKLEDITDNSMKQMIASGYDQNGNKIIFDTDTYGNLEGEDRKKVLDRLFLYGWRNGTGNGTTGGGYNPSSGSTGGVNSIGGGYDPSKSLYSDGMGNMVTLEELREIGKNAVVHQPTQDINDGNPSTPITPSTGSTDIGNGISNVVGGTDTGNTNDNNVVVNPTVDVIHDENLSDNSINAESGVLGARRNETPPKSSGTNFDAIHADAIQIQKEIADSISRFDTDLNRARIERANNAYNKLTDAINNNDKQAVNDAYKELLDAYKAPVWSERLAKSRNPEYMESKFGSKNGSSNTNGNIVTTPLSEDKLLNTAYSGTDSSSVAPTITAGSTSYASSTTNGGKNATSDTTNSGKGKTSGTKFDDSEIKRYEQNLADNGGDQGKKDAAIAKKYYEYIMKANDEIAPDHIKKSARDYYKQILKWTASKRYKTTGSGASFTADEQMEALKYLYDYVKGKANEAKEVQTTETPTSTVTNDVPQTTTTPEDSTKKNETSYSSDVKGLSETQQEKAGTLFEGINSGDTVGFGLGKTPSIFSSKDKPLNALGKRVADQIASGAKAIGSFSSGKFTTTIPATAMAGFDAWYQRFQAKGYKMGGIPDSGEIFVSRENGTPEFVGSFGNKTAVANNDQIVTAVANGVSMAQDRVVSAIENQTNTLANAIDDKDLNVNIGDRQIAEANRRGERGLGRPFTN